MVSDAIDWMRREASKKILLGYALCGILILCVPAAMSVVSTTGWEDALIALAPKRLESHQAAEAKQKLRAALDVLPKTLGKLGLALLGIAALGRLVRSIESHADDAGIASASGALDTSSPASMRSHRALDWLVPIALGAAVLAQVAAVLNRPLEGDELINYEWHLKLPFTGVLTSMEGANNQLGFSVLAWTSLRVFGDTPFSVRLPALLAAIILPGLVYRLGSREVGRTPAAFLGLFLAIWPDCLAAAALGRSYSLLMVATVLNIHMFRKFVATGAPRDGRLFALTMLVACTFHMWYAIVIAAQLLFVCLIKLEYRFSRRSVGIRASLPVETFILYMTLGCVGAVLAQAGIVHKFLFILTQKNPTPVDAPLVLTSMLNCLEGNSFVNELELPTLIAGRRQLVQGILGCLLVVGVIQNLAAFRGRAPALGAARFDLGFFAVVFCVSFLAVYVQKPVYIYARFFLYLPILLSWVAARGWSTVSLRQASAARSPARVELLRSV